MAFMSKGFVPAPKDYIVISTKICFIEKIPNDYLLNPIFSWALPGLFEKRHKNERT